MNAFEILLVLLFGSILTLVVAAGLCLFGRRPTGIALFRHYAVFLAAYFAAVVATSLGTPQRELALGETLCFDDWCITIEDLGVSKSQKGDRYVVAARLSSRARRDPQRENGIVLYLIDATGGRHVADHLESDSPFDVQLLPDQGVDVTRTFELPSGAVPSGVVVAHEGGFPITWFIIGQGPFGEPPIYGLQ